MNRSTLRQASLRAELIESLDGVCARCGFNDSRALQFDHIVAVGRPRSGNDFGIQGLRKTRKNIAEGKIQLLCANCNWIKRTENKKEQGGRESHKPGGIYGGPNVHCRVNGKFASHLVDSTN